MAILEQRKTDRFILRYDNAVPSAQSLAQAMGDVIEADFFKLRQYLPFDNDKSPDAFQRHPTIVIFMALSSAAALETSVNFLPLPGGASNSGGVETNFRSGTILINVNGASGGAITLEFARFLFIAEMSEQLMPAHGYVPGGNKIGASRGEALSRILAEQFFPEAGYQSQCVSIAPWVNGWLQSLPRPDYLNQNPAPTAVNPQLGGDLDSIGYGCGILFFNYLRYQLGYPLSAILGAGGTTFADTYRNLTGRTDDPLAALNTLLAKHFPPGGMNLLNNNPFPLFDADKRSVSFGAFRTSVDIPRIISEVVPTDRVAHVSPFVACPAKNYKYWYINQAVTWTVNATVSGFLVPAFRWKIHLTPLNLASGTTPVTVTFDVPQPTDPSAPKSSTGEARFGYQFKDISTKTDKASQLTITNLDYEGVYHLEVSVEINETYSPDQPTHATISLGFDALTIRYEKAFYHDQAVCAARFTHAIPDLVKQVDLVPISPDPPDSATLSKLIAGIDRIRQTVAEIGRKDPSLARNAAIYAGTKLGVNARLLMPSIKSAAPELEAQD